MSRSVDWSSIAKPLDLNTLQFPSNYLYQWLSYTQTNSGVLLQAEMADSQPVEIRLDVIKPDVIRVRANPDHIREEYSYMLIRNSWETVDFSIAEEENLLVITTSILRIEVQKFPWQIRAFKKDGQRPFFSERIDNRAYGPSFEVTPTGFDRDSDDIFYARQTIAAHPGEAFYGFGEKFTSLEKWNQEIISWAIDSGNVTSYRSYKNVPFFMSTAGYGIFVHTSFPTVFRMGTESSIAYSFHIANDQLDYFLMYGPSFKHILKHYCDLTGYAPVPPKWSFGFWISRCMYKSREEVEAVINGMRKRNFPCDVLNIDPWWMGEGPWSTLEWDTTCFPDPEGMIAWMREQGVRLCLWVTPYAPEGTDLYNEGVGKGFFIRKEDGSISPALEAFGGGQLAAIDFTDQEQTTWYQSKLERLLDQGVAVFKTDFGEQAPVDAVYSDGRSGLEMHNIYPLLYNGAVFNLTERKFGQGLTWGRSGYAGSQRYPVQWGGDSYASLGELTGQIRALLGYGLSGVPFCSHDVGGFDYSPHAFDTIRGGEFTEELLLSDMLESYPRDPITYIRWMQFGVFSSHIRAHGKGPQEPWDYGEQAEIIARQYLELRYRLLPYIYSAAVQSAQSGLPVVRPMVLEYQDDPATYHVEMQYMFGDSFLVAPVTDATGYYKVYLPAGDWVDYWTKDKVQGGQWLEGEAQLETMPLWVKAGSIVPFGPKMLYVDEHPLNPLTLEFYHPEEKEQITIHDEDKPEITTAYHRQADSLTVKVTNAHAAVELLVYGLDVKHASIEGETVEIHRDEKAAGIRVDNGVELEVVFHM